MSASLDLVSSLSSARRAVQLYPPAHPSHSEAIQAIVSAVSRCTADGTGFVLNAHEGRLYEGSRVIASDTPAVGSLAQSMERHGIESLTFAPTFAASDAVALAEVLNLRASSSLKVDEELAGRGVTAIIVGSFADPDELEQRKERDLRREKDRALYRQLVTAMRAVHRDVADTGSPDLAQAKDMVGDIMSRLLEDNAAVLGMATLNARHDGGLYHAVNVMIYALTLGLGLGLPEEGLVSLGIAALLHDVGKSAFDLSDPEQARSAEELHPTVGAEVLARLPDEDPATMLVAFEHHMAADGSGWPERPAGHVTHPYSRMVAVANRYEGLTKHGDGDETLTPDRAVVQLLREADRKLDPLFTRVFVRSLGVFPIGCVVRLSDQCVGVVCATNPDLLSPRVRIVYDTSGVEMEEPADVDLTADPRVIVEVVDPDAVRLEVADRL